MKARPITLAGKLYELAKLPLNKRIELQLGWLMEMSKDKAATEKDVELKKKLEDAANEFNRRRQTLRQGFTNIHGYRSLEESATSIESLSREIITVPRFTLDKKVADAVARMQTTPLETILAHFDKARPSFNKMWFELGTPGSLQKGFLVTFNEKKGIELCCVLIKDPHKPTSVPTGFYNRKILITYDSVATPYSKFENGAWNERALISSPYPDPYREDAHIALCTFLLMNSRSKVIKAEPEVRARDKLGYVEPVGLRPVTFDLSRVLRNHPGISAQDAERILSEQMVRGHFKVRNTGVFFWSPHIRNMQAGSTPEEAWDRQLKRDRVDTIQAPHRELVQPNGTPLPGLTPQ